jgi:two-component system NtrC family sensor kinase
MAPDRAMQARNRDDMETQAREKRPAVTLTQEATLLLVDDDEHVLRALRRVLRRSRCHILEAPDAARALEILEQEPVHVVVSDYRMPGMSGVEFLRLVKDRYPRVQRVLLTGQADSSAIEEAVNQSEIFRFIWKPWDDSHLLLTIQSAVDQYWLVDENHRLGQLLTVRGAELERLNRELDQKLEARAEALKRAADEWRLCFDSIGDPLVIVRGGCEVVRANSAFARGAGVAVNALPGLRCRDHAFGRLPCPQPHLSHQLERETAFGGRAWLLRAFPFGDGASVVVYKDVTEEREVTRRLFQAEKMAALGQLAGGVAHEINNPLGGILAFAQIMSQDDRTAQDLENLRLINDAALRAKRIVESLLRFSRVPLEHERGEVELAKVVEDALFLLGSQLKDARVAVERRLAPVRVTGNANQLQQVVVNLVVNALQAVGGAGRIAVETGAAPGGRVRLAVSDTGPGVPPELAERIFEPFFTTKPEGQGTGLGLSICYRIAEVHGGSIRMEPPPGGGARFVVDLPQAG